MITKTKKQEILRKIKERYPITREISGLGGSPLGSSIQMEIQSAIKYHVDQCFEILIEELYTHEDFENDLGLPK